MRNLAAAERRLDGIDRWEIGRVCVPADEGIARRIDRNAVWHVTSCSPDYRPIGHSTRRIEFRDENILSSS